MFALMMGLSRLFYSKFEQKINLELLMIFCSGVCAACYVLCAVCPSAVLRLIFCGLCGLSIGIAWPGIYVLAPKYCHGVSTASFALLALGGDLGCAAGPTLVGFISDSFGSISFGFLGAVIFPLLLFVGVITVKTLLNKRNRGQL